MITIAIFADWGFAPAAHLQAEEGSVDLAEDVKQEVIVDTEGRARERGTGSESRSVPPGAPRLPDGFPVTFPCEYGGQGIYPVQSILIIPPNHPTPDRARLNRNSVSIKKLGRKSNPDNYSRCICRPWIRAYRSPGSGGRFGGPRGGRPATHRGHCRALQ